MNDKPEKSRHRRSDDFVTDWYGRFDDRLDWNAPLGGAVLGCIVVQENFRGGPSVLWWPYRLGCCVCGIRRYFWVNTQRKVNDDGRGIHAIFPSEPNIPLLPWEHAAHAGTCLISDPFSVTDCHGKQISTAAL